METATKGDKILRATLYEVERGLFQVSYRMDFLVQEKSCLPPFQVGTDASDARRHIEERAREQGYEAIIWDVELVSPAVPFAGELDRSVRLSVDGMSDLLSKD